MKAFHNFGVELWNGDDLERTHYTKTITEAIEYAKKPRQAGYTIRFITANEYAIRIEYIDDPEAAKISAQETRKRREAIAARLDELIDPWDKEDDSQETILETLGADPLAIIEDLLTRIEDLEA